ncbi:MAG: Na/Pi cotransporter family protein [Christensenellales bacterium]|jgi:phosphate:Na+ symporter|nr:Na/Pi cotransporter family protein [Clostridiales bacterium]
MRYLLTNKGKINYNNNMGVSDLIANILIMLGGLAIFMYGLNAMSGHLEKQTGRRLRKVFSKSADNRILGVGIGAGVTAVIQSSSATTVMVIGLVNAGIMNLHQATAIIMGANIGTTITAVIISLPIMEFVAASGLIGIILMFSKKRKARDMGKIIIYLSMIFTGLLVMSGAMGKFAQMQSVRHFFQLTANPFLLVLIGLIVTAIVQSSSATTGILIALSFSGLIDIEKAMFVILGINVGTCVTALLASIGANVNAKRAALIHLMFNLAGMIIYFVLLSFSVIRNGVVNMLNAVASILSAKGAAAQIAAFHVLFNVSVTLILLPFIKQIVALSLLIMPKGKEKKSQYELKYINERILKSSPTFAVEQIKKELLRMAEMSKANLDIAVKAVCEINLKQLDEFTEREEYIDWLNREIPLNLTKISALPISFEDKLVVGSYYHVVSDIERIGDYAENIMEYAERLDVEGLKFSEEALSEIKTVINVMDKLYSLSIDGFSRLDLSLLEDVNKLEDEVDTLKQQLTDTHIKRLGKGVCSALSGAIFISLVSNLERISDHIRNIFYSIRKYV